MSFSGNKIFQFLFLQQAFFCFSSGYHYFFSVPPQLVTLQNFGVFIENQSKNLTCNVSSVYYGLNVTEFRIKVGEEVLSSGVKNESPGVIAGTYSLSYIQPAVFTYNSHQGKQVQCEVTWMNGTSAETVITHGGYILNIHCEFYFNYLFLFNFVICLKCRCFMNI